MEKRTWFKALFGGQGMVMETRFSPARKDVERYQGLRTLKMDLNHRMTKTIPRQAYDDVGRAIGILRKGVLVFDNEDMTSVLMDSAFTIGLKAERTSFSDTRSNTQRNPRQTSIIC